MQAYGNSCLNVLFLVEDAAKNLSDQKQIEFKLRSLNPKINPIRRSFKQLNEELRLDENRLLFVGKHEIAVVYYRDAYSPQDYTETNIKLRTKIELSKGTKFDKVINNQMANLFSVSAIKCPTIQHHLSGVKKIQQILTDKDVLRKFCTDNESLEKVHSTFTGIWPLSLDDKGDKAFKMAIENPERYVLKPQR